MCTPWSAGSMRSGAATGKFNSKPRREHAIKYLGSAAMADAFTDSFLRYQDREDTASYCTLFFVSGRKPP